MNTVKVQTFLNGLSRPDLVTLNKMVVSQIHKVDRDAGAMQAMQYHIGQRVEFKSRIGQWITATVYKINQKTLSVKTVDPPYNSWRVAFCYVRPSQS